MRMLTRMTQTPGDDALLNTVQAAARLGISRRKLMGLIYSGDIATIRIPSGRTGKAFEHRIEPAEIHRFIERNRQGAST